MQREIMSSVRAVLFDLDDTLTASNEFAADVLSAAASEHGVDITAEAVRRHRGAVFVPMMQDVFGIERTMALGIYSTYVERYESMMPGRLTPTHGADALLGALRGDGVPLALVTNKSHSLASAVLALFGWRDAFSVLVGHDSSSGHKPHPAPALMALEHLRCRPEHAAFVGDSASDMECARRAGVAVRIALTGSTPAADLVQAGATNLCSDLAEVLALLAPEPTPTI